MFTDVGGEPPGAKGGEPLVLLRIIAADRLAQASRDRAENRLSIDEGCEQLCIHW